MVFGAGRRESLNMPDPGAGRRRFLLGVALGATATSLLGLGASTVVKSPAQLAAEQAPPPPAVITAPVERRVLRDTVVLRGTVAPARTVEVTPASSVEGGELVVTGLPLQEGSAVRAGQVLAEVSGRPLVALPGRVPAYRDLRPGSKGKDVEQLQTALERLGFDSGDPPGVFGAGTKRALSGFYASIGYEVATTGEEDEQALREARRRVREAERAVVRARQAARAPEGAPPAAGSARLAVEEAEDELALARQELADLERRTGPMLPRSEAVFLPSFPARLSQINGSVGSVVEPPLLVLSSGGLVVRATLPPPERSLVKAGQRVEIVSEVEGITATGRVASIGPLSSGAGGEGEGDQEGAGEPRGYPMTITGRFDARLAGQDVRLAIEAASTQGPVLVVPLAAVFATADGQTEVIRVGADGRQERVRVVAGASGDGFVAVRPAGNAGDRLAPGDRVVVGQ